MLIMILAFAGGDMERLRQRIVYGYGNAALIYLRHGEHKGPGRMVASYFAMPQEDDAS